MDWRPPRRSDPLKKEHQGQQSSPWARAATYGNIHHQQSIRETKVELASEHDGPFVLSSTIHWEWFGGMWCDHHVITIQRVNDGGQGLQDPNVVVKVQDFLRSEAIKDEPRGPERRLMESSLRIRAPVRNTFSSGLGTGSGTPGRCRWRRSDPCPWRARRDS